MCSSGSIEDIEHLVMHSQQRSKMLESVDFGPECHTQSDRLDVLLGKSREFPRPMIEQTWQ